mmetsp:Transcript_45015/g.106936  ORF Transcript_45015/g.106936 Transcript_45015/m.106936 type:complete len:502 (+) Transcript_45015:37-1542(+)
MPVERWHLRPELEFTHHLDSWNVRSAPSLEAHVITILKAGEAFDVKQKDGDWLEIKCDYGAKGWSYRRFQDVDALGPVDEGTSQIASAAEDVVPMIRRESSRQEKVSSLLLELGERRQTLDSAIAGGDEMVKAASMVQATMDKLELLGVDQESILKVDDEELIKKVHEVVKVVNLELKREISFKHSEFANPKEESCWLSTFFQSLWHSRVFHTLFDHLVRPQPPSVGGKAANALRETWRLYERAATSGARVSVSALVEAWGAGYGDCAEAFGKLQADEALQPLAGHLALVPIAFQGSTMTPADLWPHVEQAGATQKPLLVLDMAMPALPRASILSLMLAIVPRSRGRSSEVRSPRHAVPPDLGQSHRLVAAICYMPSYAHYVVFCRRVSHQTHWLLFNDLPGLAAGAAQELPSWAAVAHECARFELVPKVLVYESGDLVQTTLEQAPKTFWDATVGRQSADTVSASKSWSLLSAGSAACLLVLLAALICQQAKEILGILLR